MAQGAKIRAELHLREIERRLEAATEPAALAELEERKAKALAKVAEAQAQLDAVQVEVQPTLDAVAQVREAALAAAEAKTAAEEEAREAKRKIAPVSVFISRATQRLYVRQALQPLFESDGDDCRPRPAPWAPTSLRRSPTPTTRRICAGTPFPCTAACLRRSRNGRGHAAPSCCRRPERARRMSARQVGARPHFHSPDALTASRRSCRPARR